MRILAIDQSLINSGVAIFDGEKLISVSSIKTGKLKGIERLFYIKKELIKLLTEYKIEKAVMENYSFGSRGRAIFNLGELGGIVRMVFFEMNIPFTEVEPKALKKRMTGNGNADKALMVKTVNEYFKLEIKDDNQADALALALVGLEKI